MSIIHEYGDYNVDLENINFELELMGLNNFNPETIDEWKPADYLRAEEAIPQEQTFYNTIQHMNGTKIIHHNTYTDINKFCGERGIDLVFTLKGKTYFTECTNPKLKS